MPFPELIRLSPNRDVLPAHERLGVLFHHSVMPFDETIAFMLRPESKVSYHTLIAPDGTRCTLVADEHIAWHAGASSFLGRSRCNDFLLGLAFAGDTYCAPLTDAQFASALEWLAPRWKIHRWTSACMTDHRQAAPNRKDDLHPAEWSRLHAMIRRHFEAPAKNNPPGHPVSP
ncbi:MAG TPA: N-acetylmuramoyl-L-alanine amidase [Opitutaceae bacterium]|nr:N-acetylmuramoyl-L-alanine amidase [Opitutaceae bacterium]